MSTKDGGAAPDYLSIRTGSLAGDTPTTFNTYVKVGAKYVLYCRNGDVFDSDRLLRLKRKKINSLYILKEDSLPYHLYLQKNVEAAYTHAEGTPIEIRANVIVSYNCDLIENLFNAINDQDIYIEMKNSSLRFIDFLCGEPEALKAILEIFNEDGSVAHHGVRVAAIATALAQAMNLIDNNRPMHLMVIGAFLHDLDFVHSGFEYRRTIASLSKDELKEYKKHPLDGAQKVQASAHMDALVQQIILQHEEHADASGFPKGLKEDQMDPTVLLVGVANAFDRLVSFEQQNPKDALKHLLIDKLGAYPLPLLQGLQSLLKARGIVA